MVGGRLQASAKGKNQSNVLLITSLIVKYDLFFINFNSVLNFFNL